jgi:hypothetical protein
MRYVIVHVVNSLLCFREDFKLIILISMQLFVLSFRRDCCNDLFIEALRLLRRFCAAFLFAFQHILIVLMLFDCLCCLSVATSAMIYLKRCNFCSKFFSHSNIMILSIVLMSVLLFATSAMIC